MEDLSHLPVAELARKTQALFQQACPDREAEPFYNRNMALAKGMGLTWLEGLQFVIKQRKSLN